MTLCSPIRGETIRTGPTGVAATSRMPPRPDSRSSGRIAWPGPSPNVSTRPGSVAAHSAPAGSSALSTDVAPGLRPDGRSSEKSRRLVAAYASIVP